MGTPATDESVCRMMRAEWLELHAALTYAAVKHAGQIDKGHEPYLWHCLRVGASLLPDSKAAILGILHDVIEDTDATLEEVARFVDNDAELLADLDALTRRADETYRDYLDRVLARPRALKVKIADIGDNLDETRLMRGAVIQGEGWMSEKKLKYELALSYLGGTKIITFCKREPEESTISTDMTP